MTFETPHHVTATTIACPFDDGAVLAIEIGWVGHDNPSLHLNCPELVDHMRQEHGHS